MVAVDQQPRPNIPTHHGHSRGYGCPSRPEGRNEDGVKDNIESGDDEHGVLRTFLVAGHVQNVEHGSGEGIG